MIVGGMLGILFIALLRRVMVEDPDLPFPESVAAAEIHKAGQQGSKAAKILFSNMGIGAFIYFLGSIKLFLASNQIALRVGQLGISKVSLVGAMRAPMLKAGGMTTFAAPAISPAYMGVGYIIGPRLGALNFAGGMFAWGLLVPLLVFLLGPQLPGAQAADYDWASTSIAIWSSIVRPIAVGGMLVGASYTLFKMRKQLGVGVTRAIADLKKSAAQHASTERTERDLNGKVVFGMMAVIFVGMVALYYYFTGVVVGSILAAVVMLVMGFFFAAVSGNLVGMIGSSNNPVSGLTLCALIVSALFMVAIGVDGPQRSGRRARRGGGHLRVLGGVRRHAPGPQGRPHPGRHADQDAGRPSDQRRGLGRGAVLPPDGAAQGLHVRHPAAAGAAGGAHGTAWPRGSWAARWPGRWSWWAS